MCNIIIPCTWKGVKRVQLKIDYIWSLSINESTCFNTLLKKKKKKKQKKKNKKKKTKNKKQKTKNKNKIKQNLALTRHVLPI